MKEARREVEVYAEDGQPLGTAYAIFTENELFGTWGGVLEQHPSNTIALLPRVGDVVRVRLRDGREGIITITKDGPDDRDRCTFRGQGPQAF